MGEAIYIKHGQNLTRLELTDHSCEDDFQKLIEDHPDLLAGDQVDPASPRRWLLLKREAGVPSEQGGNDRWSLDHLFIDQDAIPTLVEVKRKNNRELRRQVVGQMMDYAANAVAYWPESTLKNYFYQTAEAQHQDPQAILSNFLKDNIADLTDEETFWQTANENLRSGNVRLIFVAERIPPELQRIVEFMNERMSPTEVLALELRRYSGGQFSTHIPRILGQTVAAQIAKQSGIAPKPKRARWNKESFLEDASQRLEPAHVESLRQMIDLFYASGFDKIEWGTGTMEGSCSPKYSSISTKSPVTIWSGGQLSIKLGWLYGNGVENDFRLKLQEKLKEAGLPYECEYNEFINVPVGTWSQWMHRLITAIQLSADEVLHPPQLIHEDHLAPSFQLG